ncbi:MAG: MBL fold metallo-hydrolase [Flavobacteriales bacterium]|nr:MBL fold metallo-hydrolase [Flavobacteriales bacterium]
MKIEQIYTSCLAQGSYYIESNGEAAVIDPLREVGAYITMAADRGAKIKYIFETHFHADFVSGHLTLAQQTGADIVFGPTAKTDFECLVANDSQKFKVGDITIKLLHTPGHTMESSSYLLIDERGVDKALFSGDTLFLGDVGRPDLAQKPDLTEKDLAGILFDSLRTKIMTLPDEVIVYPGHGAGSACGKNMSKETVGSIGYEKVNNYALRADMTKKEFVQEVTEGIFPPPAYFPENVRLNKQGYNPENDNVSKANISLTVEEFKVKSEEKNVIILDVRSATDFVNGFILNSIFIGIDGGFAPWVGAIIKKVDTPILLVCDKNRLEEVAIRLSRVGFDNILGHLSGGIDSWKEDDLQTISSISANIFNDIYQEDNTINIVDVRKEVEYKSRHIVSAVLNPLSDLENDKLNTTAENFVHCAGGYRSVIACSLLKRDGIHNITNIEGGFGVIKKTKLPLSVEVCPSTL